LFELEGRDIRLKPYRKWPKLEWQISTTTPCERELI
jgi:hypothetical protein